MNFKVKKVNVKNLTNPSHHMTNIGGPVNLKTGKIKVPKVATATNLTRTGLNRFKNLMRYLKSK